MEWVFAISGFAIGVLLSNAIFSIRSRHGTLHIFKQDGKDIYRFEIDDISNLNKRKVILKVKSRE